MTTTPTPPSPVTPHRPVRRLLAVGPDASRGIASRSLLELVRWARHERGVEATVVLLDGGPLVDDLAEVATVVIAPRLVAGPRRLSPPPEDADGAPARPGRTLLPDRARTMAFEAWLGRALARSGPADVVVAASADVLPVLRHLPSGAAPVVAHLHELVPPGPDDEGVVEVLGRAALVVVPCAEVAELVVRPRADDGYGVAEARVRHHLGPVGPPGRHRPPARDDVALVAGWGPVDWRAGVDRFVALAATVGPEVAGRAVHWTWIGGSNGDPVEVDAADEIALRGLGHRIHMAGEVADGPDRLAAADLLAVTARHDPSPLAAVDAALAGTPIVGFRPGTALLAAAGQDDRRVEHLDVDALAAQVVDLLASPDRARVVAAPQARAAARATTPLAAPDLWADIERTAAGGGER